MAVIFGSVGAFALIVAIVAICCVSHFVGFSECVGSEKYDYTTLVPKGESGAKYPTVIYAHGAESDYKADYTTLKSLAKSGIACYTFDFYG